MHLKLKYLQSFISLTRNLNIYYLSLIDTNTLHSSSLILIHYKITLFIINTKNFIQTNVTILKISKTNEMKTFQVNLVLVQRVDKKRFFLIHIFCYYKKVLYIVSMTYKRNVPSMEP